MVFGLLLSCQVFFPPAYLIIPDVIFLYISVAYQNSATYGYITAIIAVYISLKAVPGTHLYSCISLKNYHLYTIESIVLGKTIRLTLHE